MRSNKGILAEDKRTELISFIIEKGSVSRVVTKMHHIHRAESFLVSIMRYDLFSRKTEVSIIIDRKRVSMGLASLNKHAYLVTSMHALKHHTFAHTHTRTHSHQTQSLQGTVGYNI